MPETRYVSVGDADIAYQVFGDGPRDLLFVYGQGSHVEAVRDVSFAREALRRLTSFSRLIVFDRRGTGASDPVGSDAFPTWEEWAEDLGVVLDAEGSQQTAILANVEAGGMAILFAAMHPARVSALVLVNTSARFLAADDHPFGVSPQARDAFVDWTRKHWGTPEYVRLVTPSMAGDPEFLAFTARTQRMAMTPRAAAAQTAFATNIDVRAALLLIQAPTLVLHSRDSTIVPVQHGRYLADHIPGARLVELPGSDIGWSSAMALQIADEVADFLTGHRPAIEADRVLTTVLFTDMVSSTEQLAARGDDAWRRVLEDHDHTMSRVVSQYRGSVIKQLGDGILATFDGPARAVRCASALLEAARNQGISLRAGLHTGEIELRPSDVAGIAVHIASRIAALAEPNEILVSRTVVDLTAGSGLQFAPRGEYELKGVPGTWSTFAAQTPN
jgi:class 3 adenylate cyclase